MSFLSRLSGIFVGQPKSSPKTPQKSQKSPRPKTVKHKQTVAPRAESIKSSKKSLVSSKQAQNILNEAKSQAREIIIEAKDEAFKIKQEAEQTVTQKRKELDEIQHKMYQTQADLDRKLGRLEEKEKIIEKSQTQIEEKNKQLDQLKAQQIDKLEKISNLSREEAKNILIDATEKKLKSDLGRMIQENEDQIREESEDKAREIIIDAMRHGATDYVAEYTVSSVKISDEEVKGRIIGKEGRNIRAFEQASGVDVDLDEEGVIRISCFDPVRREVARVSLEKLIRDGRVQPARIEEVVSKTQEEIDRLTYKAGQELCHRVKVFNLPKPIVELLGKFKYRYSYGQNLISHTIEVTKIGVALAQETGANVNIVRLGCLLHDIGKVIMEEEGTHVDLGVEFLRKHGIPEAVLASVSEHHQDKDFSSAESVLVYVADAVSGARPGARYADYEGYVKRMRELEEAALSFEGVKKAYAIQAGREVRVIVDPQDKDDAGTYKLAQDIRDKIKKELTYPGSVKVTAIREVRKIEIAN